MNEQPRSTHLVLFEDPWFLAVHKPAGLSAQPDPSGDIDLFTTLRLAFPKPELGLVHRLDRPVSGVMLFARGARALEKLNAQFRDRTIRKTYWAIVEGVVESAAELRNTITHDPRNRKARITVDVERPNASLQIEPMAAGDRYTLLRVVPSGGAFHQIRAQLGAAGHAIKGDVKYGARRGEKDRSIALHAHSIEFDHPESGDRTTFRAPDPVGGLWDVLRTKYREPTGNG